MIKYIGDISKNDALVLEYFASNAKEILEFGMGASTQVLSNYKEGNITSIETNSDWIEKTRKNIDLLRIDSQVNMMLYDDFMAQEHTKKYDLIFNDGVDHLRREFGLYAFDKLLKPNGVILFHDQRRTGDVHNMAEVIRIYSAYIEWVQINYKESNITVIKKRSNPDALFYEDWNVIEEKKGWESGQGDIPESEIANLIK